MTIYGIHAYIILMNWSKFCVTLGYNCYMMNIIQHNYHHRSNAYELFTYCSLLSYYRCYYCHNCYKTTAATVTVTITIIAIAIKLPYYWATEHSAADI